MVSAFEAHSLIPVTYIVSNVMAGALRLAVAKMLDLWGRPQGFAVMVVIATLGLIMMATCHNVQTFAAAQVCSDHVKLHERWILTTGLGLLFCWFRWCDICI